MLQMKPNWIITGICGFSTALLLTILSLDDLSRPLMVSIGCLAISLPILASAALLPLGATHEIDRFHRTRASGCLVMLGILFSALAYAGVFFHLASWAGSIFIGSTLFVIFIMTHYKGIGK